MRILAALRAHGPMTATALARRLDLNSGATSYHLRQLATYGFIVEAAELGNRRDRFWRADSAQESPADGGTAEAPREGSSAGGVSGGDAAEDRVAGLQSSLLGQAGAAQTAVEGYLELAPPWREVTTFAAHELSLTPAQAATLLARLESVILEAAEEAQRDSDESSAGRATDPRPFVVQLQAYVRPE